MAEKKVKTEPSETAETLRKKPRTEPSCCQPQFSMKLLIDNGAKRVLFAEADKGCVDFLLFILSLPVSTLIRLVGKQDIIGSVTNLYESVETLDASFVLENETKDSLLNLPITPKFLGYNNIPGASAAKAAAEKKKILYRCKRRFPYNDSLYNDSLYNAYCSGYSTGYRSGGNNFKDCVKYVSNGPRGVCPACQSLMSSGLMEYVEAPAEGGGFVKDGVKFVVMDDLVVKPVKSVMCSINLVAELGVNNVSDLEEKVVVLGIDEGVKLLKASLVSKNVLTSVFLEKN